jgi:transposase-like protein
MGNDDNWLDDYKDVSCDHIEMASGGIIRTCPHCHSIDFVKNGKSRHGKQNYKCRCGKQFSSFNVPVSEEVRVIVGRLLDHKIPISIIASATGTSAGFVYGIKKKRSKKVT